MSESNFTVRRRQIFLDEESYRNTLAQIEQERIAVTAELDHPELTYQGKAGKYNMLASDAWRLFQLHYTGGEDLDMLAASLTGVVTAFEQYAAVLNEADEDDRLAPFRFVDMLDYYVDYLNLLSAAYLMRRRDLVPRVARLYTESEYDQTDALVEELLSFELSDRPRLDEWYWDKPFDVLMDTIDSDTPEEATRHMKKYVKVWYPKMKGRAHFWGKHEKIVREFTPYHGYWAMCAAAFTVLNQLDDTSYRNELVYPKDMADYARAAPEQPPPAEEK